MHLEKSSVEIQLVDIKFISVVMRYKTSYAILYLC